MPEGPLNENGYAHSSFLLLFFGLLSLANIYVRVKKDRAKRAASKPSARPAKIMKQSSQSIIGKLLPVDKLKPGPWSIYSQVACAFWMISSGIIFAMVPCEVYEGFMWRWITAAYPLSSVFNYLFLFAKQNTVKGTNPLNTTVLLGEIFLTLVFTVPFIGLAYMIFLVKGRRNDDGMCVPVWEPWAPMMLCFGDTGISAICLYLFIKPLHNSMKTMGKGGGAPDDKLYKVLKRNLSSCLLTMSTSLVTMVACCFCGPNPEQLPASLFAAAWCSLDKWTDILAINVAFDDFKDASCCGGGGASYKVAPSGQSTEMESSGASTEGD